MFCCTECFSRRAPTQKTGKILGAGQSSNVLLYRIFRAPCPYTETLKNRRGTAIIKCFVVPNVSPAVPLHINKVSRQ
ncbi:hypothetical protein [Microseira wollei]|nr:hypothetical protein [Microseira wollei]